MPRDAMSLDRLRELLDAYGAEPARWPDAERAAAEALLARSAEARALRDAARGLDHVLDRAPAAPAPPAALVSRILATAPDAARASAQGPAGHGDAAAHGDAPATRPPPRARPLAARAGTRTRVRRLLAAAVPLAAAAGLALWLGRGTDAPDDQIADATVDVGSYTTPTDTLLDVPGVDLIAGLPAVGCEDSDLGCPDLGPQGEGEPRSHHQRQERKHA